MTDLKLYILLFLLLFFNTLHFFERRDLYNRIMSRDLNEYNSGSRKPGHIENIIKKNFIKHIKEG